VYRVGCEDEFLLVTTQCRVAEIIRHDEDDVELVSRLVGGVECGQRREQQNSCE
jgi:hypothetical protein